jgi:NTP pyrophosphatase (non-canonical NTP hydrolase)
LKSIQELQNEVAAWARSKGWYDSPVSFGEAIALLHSEVSEALEAYRETGLESYTAHAIDQGEGESLPKPEGVGSEFADVLICLLDYAERFSIDLEGEYVRKMAYNETRAYRHGNKLL